MPLGHISFSGFQTVTGTALGILPLYNETKDSSFSSILNQIRPSPPSSNTQGSRFGYLQPSTMSGSDLRGRWMPSSVTEEDVLKLRDARYLTYEISHRLPARGQVIPTPEPGESVVFVSHLRRGLGFPMDPFVRGLLFYYGLEFHD